MIVRILSDNQYQLDNWHKPAIAQLDNGLFEAVQQGDQAAFARLLFQLVQLIRENGQPVPSHKLVASDVMVPASDVTLHAAQHFLKKTDLLVVSRYPAIYWQA
ncbi:MAG TPA: hypothetical protein VH599_09055 [Ktedonobacterales bacterium]|jgi:hypothetical protein